MKNQIDEKWEEEWQEILVKKYEKMRKALEKIANDWSISSSQSNPSLNPHSIAKEALK